MLLAHVAVSPAQRRNTSRVGGYGGGCTTVQTNVLLESTGSLISENDIVELNDSDGRINN